MLRGSAVIDARGKESDTDFLALMNLVGCHVSAHYIRWYHHPCYWDIAGCVQGPERRRNTNRDGFK
jgi:hypothetical protein